MKTLVKKISRKRSITQLVFLVFFSSTLSAEWTEITSMSNGDVFSIDFDRVTTDANYVYYWRLSNYAQPTKYHDMSALVHVKVDCKSNRTMDMQVTFFPQHDATGEGKTLNRKPKWNNVHPNGTAEILYHAVCNFVGRHNNRVE